MNSIIQSIRLSRPKEQILYGIAIRKMSVGHYLDALAALSEVSGELIELIFAGRTPKQTLLAIREMTAVELKTELARLLFAAPEILLKGLSVILGCEEKKLRDELSPAELSEVLLAFWQVNDLTDFFGRARLLLTRAMARSGFKN